MTDSKDLDVGQLIDKLEQDLRSEISARNIHDPVMIGVHTGGVWIATQLHQRLKIRESLGVLNISFYRDDFSQIGMHPQVVPSHLPFSVEERDVILVDDVLFTGRTIRAGLNEIFDYGRPKQVVLAVLINRNGRQIPVQADCVGVDIMLKSNRQIKLIGPDPLDLVTRELDDDSITDNR